MERGKGKGEKRGKGKRGGRGRRGERGGRRGERGRRGSVEMGRKLGEKGTKGEEVWRGRWEGRGYQLYVSGMTNLCYMFDLSCPNCHFLQHKDIRNKTYIVHEPQNHVH